jgi:hypothetical protein
VQLPDIAVALVSGNFGIVLQFQYIPTALAAVWPNNLCLNAGRGRIIFGAAHHQHRQAEVKEHDT